MSNFIQNNIEIISALSYYEIKFSSICCFAKRTMHHGVDYICLLNSKGCRGMNKNKKNNK